MVAVFVQNESPNATARARLTASTPGKPVTLSEISEINCRPCVSSYPLRLKSNDAVTTFAGSNPGSIVCKARKLLTHKPAPISTTSDKAICTTTSTLRRLHRRPPPRRPGLSPLRAATKSGLETCSAGASPKTIPVRSDSPSVKPSARPSRRPSKVRGTKLVCCWNPNNRLVTQYATSKPAPLPSAARIVLSVNNCRTMRKRLAPTARRTAISLRRAEARTRSRLATFAQAINKTNPATPIKSFKGNERSLTRSVCPRLPSIREMLTDSFPFALGTVSLGSSANSESAACACSRLTSGLSLPIKHSQPQLRLSSTPLLPGSVCACIMIGT